MAKYLFVKLSETRPKYVMNFGFFVKQVDYEVSNYNQWRFVNLMFANFRNILKYWELKKQKIKIK